MKSSFVTIAYRFGRIHINWNGETCREEIIAQFQGQRIACASLHSAKRAVSDMMRIEHLSTHVIRSANMASL